MKDTLSLVVNSLDYLKVEDWLIITAEQVVRYKEVLFLWLDMFDIDLHDLSDVSARLIVLVTLKEYGEALSLLFFIIKVFPSSDYKYSEADLLLRAFYKIVEYEMLPSLDLHKGYQDGCEFNKVLNGFHQVVQCLTPFRNDAEKTEKSILEVYKCWQDQFETYLDKCKTESTLYEQCAKELIEAEEDEVKKLAREQMLLRAMTAASVSPIIQQDISDLSYAQANTELPVNSQLFACGSDNVLSNVIKKRLSLDDSLQKNKGKLKAAGIFLSCLGELSQKPVYKKDIYLFGSLSRNIQLELNDSNSR